MITTSSSKYIGRFAPSPSGPLHFGSLVCALASYIDAKRHSGRWLLRIEDIDPPREQTGARDAILRCLEAHGLFWDGEVRYQSTRSDAYLRTLNWLQQQDLTYRCNCTRKRLSPLEGHYDGHCRRRPPTDDQPVALRLKVGDLPPKYQQFSSCIRFTDRIKGEVEEDLARTGGDFVIHRKDGFFAYQLAVVVDDIEQGITDVVRGDDLLDTTAKQIWLYKLLGKQPPSYAHIPVIRDTCGNKLSKQNHAPAVDNSKASFNLLEAAAALELNLPSSIDEQRLPPPEKLLTLLCQ